MSTKLNVETFIAVLRKSGLLDRDRIDSFLAEYQASGGAQDDPVALSDRMIAAGLLTAWQTEKLLQGKHRGYFLGKYKLLSLLGKGGMSSVYLAEHLLLRRRCALKVLPAKRVDDSSYLERFHREAQAVAALDHPNIVRAYDVDHQNDGDRQIHFIVMEHVDGQSLQELVTEKGTLSFLDAAEYARQAALGLKHAHEQGMIHRDIKPGNLLVDQSGVVKVLDLGLARFFMVDEGNEALTIRHDEKVLGTADYLAPEQALDSHTVDVRADIYSLGCTLYFTLTGRPPFTEGTLAQRLMAHQVKVPPSVESLRQDLPPSLAAIIRKMMEKKPAERYASASETERALFEWVNENADDQWRKTHFETYGTRSSDSGSVLRAIPVAMPIAALTAHESPVEPPKKPVTPPTAKPLSFESQLPKLSAVNATESEDTSVNQFFSTLAHPTSQPASDKFKLNLPTSAAVKMVEVQAAVANPEAPQAATTEASPPFPFPLFETPVPVKPAVTKTGPIRIPTALSPMPLPQKLLESLKRLPIQVRGGIVAVAALVLVVVFYVLGSFGDFGSGQETKRVVTGPFPKDKHEVTVGGPKSEYATIRDALTAVLERYRPANGSIDRFIVRIMPGTYRERIQIDGRKKPLPEGITLVGDGDVRLEPQGAEPAISLANISRFTIENLQVEGGDRTVAIELADDLHESQLNKLVIRGFSDVGILCKGAQGLSFGNNQLLIAQVTFEPTGTRASGIRLQEGSENDVNSIIIRNCRFLGPLVAGIEIQGKAPYGIDITDSIFNRTADGIRVDGQPLLKSIHILNNSFRQTNAGVRFSNLPSEFTTDLAFRRNLFTKTDVAEVVVQQGFDEGKFRAMLFENPPGIENNWSDRSKPASPVDGEVALIFDHGGRQGEPGFALASTDPKSPKFLAPTETSPQREVPGTQPTDRKWVGAVGP